MTMTFPTSGPPLTAAQLGFSMGWRFPDAMRYRIVRDLIRPNEPGPFLSEPTFLRDGELTHPIFLAWDCPVLRIYRLADPFWQPLPPHEESGDSLWNWRNQNHISARFPAGWGHAAFRFTPEGWESLQKVRAPLRELLRPYCEGRVPWSEAEALIRRVYAPDLLPDRPRVRGGLAEHALPLLEATCEYHRQWLEQVLGLPSGGLHRHDMRTSWDAHLTHTSWLTRLAVLRQMNRSHRRCLAASFQGNPNHQFSVGLPAAWLNSWVSFHDDRGTFRLWDGPGGGGWRPFASLARLTENNSWAQSIGLRPGEAGTLTLLGDRIFCGMGKNHAPRLAQVQVHFWLRLDQDAGAPPQEESHEE